MFLKKRMIEIDGVMKVYNLAKSCLIVKIITLEDLAKIPLASFDGNDIKERVHWLVQNNYTPSLVSQNGFVHTDKSSNLDLAINELIEAFPEKVQVPNLSLFKKDFPKLAQMNELSGDTYLEESEFQESLDSYTKALSYTNRWQVYGKIPPLLEKMGRNQEAALKLIYFLLNINGIKTYGKSLLFI